MSNAGARILGLLYKQYVLGLGWRLTLWPAPACSSEPCPGELQPSPAFLASLLDALEVLTPEELPTKLAHLVCEHHALSSSGHPVPFGAKSARAPLHERR